MDKLPPELVLHISCHLPLPDLCNFRLVNRNLASAAYPIITRHVSLLNVCSSIDEFLAHFRTRKESSSCPKSLTVYHGEWPVCSRENWQVHPLFLYESHPRAFLDAAIDEVYERYVRFTSLQRGRADLKDSTVFSKLLSTLPHVTSLTLSPLQLSSRRCWSINRRLGRIRKNMWISPSFNDSMAPLIGTFLRVSQRFPQIKELIVKGRLNPLDIPIAADSPATRLEVVSLMSMGAQSEALLALIHRFPQLQHLSIRLETANGIHLPTAIQRLLIPSLRTLCLANMWISEASLSQVIDQNVCLHAIELADMTLTQGTWQSFFTCIRDAERCLGVVCNGVLDGTSLECPSIVMEDDKRYLLYRFLSNKQSRWPFRVFRFQEIIYI